MPLTALLIALRIRSEVPGQGVVRPPSYQVLGLVKLPGLALTFCSVGYAAINAFVVLLFVERFGGRARVSHGTRSQDPADLDGGRHRRMR